MAHQIENWDKLTENWHTKFKNEASQIEKWYKRSFYQGPGVKFPFSWEKITLPP